ncbi:MAG: tRNA (N6-isopentenyl adenosine(37)-C2)-methylthiotransferase MiaB [Gammaproteobacteria bacterium]|nr:tRNA (N6-isopentenyl adenosine(37)-C2)-methylthiotransferase MiaB [Gammaproteobacteria bacterium]
MARKLFIKTFGCQMNEYDSAKMRDVLAESHGLEEVLEAQDADILLLNTCSIREKAQEKVFHQLGRWRKLKDKNPDLIIGVGGCVASQEGAVIRQRAPYVDLVFGPQTIHRLPMMLSELEKSRSPMMDISFPEIEKFDHLPEPTVDGPAAFVSIMEGCSKYCTFCVVPYTRGEEVSRPFDDVLAEISKLAALGVREVNLLGQNVNAYRGEMLTEDGSADEPADLALLITYVAAIDGIDRIRFTTSHPVEFSDRLIDVYAEVPELVSFVHLPVQSGSDFTLSAMKRGHTAIEYKSKIRRLRAQRPGLTVSSDFIIGFPGESEKDFEDTMRLIDDVGFDMSYSFIYSARPGTPASEYEDDVPMDVKKQRLQRLQDKINEQAAAISHAMIGSEQRVLVERKARDTEGEITGRTENNRVVRFAGPEHLIGRFVTVKITSATTNSLRGDFVAVSDHDTVRQFAAL